MKTAAPHSVRIARRRFLQAAGGVTLALPLLPSLVGESNAQAAAVTRRFIHVFTANGQRPGNWYPQAAPEWTVLAASGQNFAREAALQGPGAISAVLGEEFAPFKSQLLLLRGLDFIQRRGQGHEPACTLGGVLGARGLSVDQVLANSSKIYPEPPPFGAPRSLHLLIKNNFEQNSSVSTTAEGVAVQPLVRPSAAFQSLFGGALSAGSDDGQVASQQQQLKLRIIDQVKDQYDALLESPRIGSEDKQRLQAHLAHIEDLETRLGSALEPLACSAPARPLDPDISDEGNLPATTSLMIDLLAAGILCDRTRVATLMLCPGTDLRNFSDILAEPVGQHHGISHEVYDPQSSVAQGQLARINNWYAQKVATLLQKLDVVEDPVSGSTFLDNCLVYWGNEDGCNDGDAHEHMGMPVLLAGRAGGNLRGGRYLDYREIEGMGADESGQRVLYPHDGTATEVPFGREFRGLPYNSLLITLLTAMGLQRDEYETEPGAGFGDYSDNYQDQYSLAAARAPLPFL